MRFEFQVFNEQEQQWETLVGKYKGQQYRYREIIDLHLIKQ